MDFTFHSALRSVHIGAGALGLLCFWIPIFAKKGGRLHLAAGRFFVRLAIVIAATAIVSCSWGLIAPVSFSGITRDLSTDEVELLSANIRFLFALLGMLTTWFVASLQVGLRAVKTRRNQSDLGDARTRTFVMISILASLLAALFGAYQYALSGQTRYFALIGLGTLGVFEGRKTLRILGKDRHGPMDWWYLHMDSMIGLGIAFHTAFFVFGASRIWGSLPGLWAIVPWVVPTLIGATATHLWTNYYRRKFEADDQRSTDGHPVAAGTSAS